MRLSDLGQRQDYEVYKYPLTDGVGIVPAGEAITRSCDPRERPFALYYRDGVTSAIRHSLQSSNSVVYRAIYQCNNACSLDKHDTKTKIQQRLRREHQDHLQLCFQCQGSSHKQERCSFLKDRQRQRDLAKCKTQLFVEVHARDLTSAHVWIRGAHEREDAHKKHLQFSHRIRNWLEVEAARQGRTTFRAALGHFSVALAVQCLQANCTCSGLTMRYGAGGCFENVPEWRRPSTEQVSHIIEVARIRNKEDRDPFISLDLMVARLVERPEKRILCWQQHDINHNDTSSPFNISIATRGSLHHAINFMRRSLFCSDASWRGMNVNGAPVELLVTWNDAQHMVPSRSASSRVIELF